MSKLPVPPGWDDLEFLFTTELESCGGSCTMKFDGTGAPVLVDNCTGTNCHCMGVLSSVVPFAQEHAPAPGEYAVPWPCIAPVETTKLLDVAVDRYLRTLRVARRMTRLAILFGLTTLLFGAGFVRLWLAR